MKRRDILGAAFASALIGGGTTAGAQQALPKDTLRILVGYPAGGSTDMVARLVAEKVKASLDRNVIVDNKAGGSGLIAIDVLKNAAPDGSAIALVPFTNAVLGPMVNKRATFDFSTDFTAVAHAVSYPLAFAVSNSIGVKTWPEFVAWAKANPSKSNFGTAGAGGLPHFFGLMLGRAAGIELNNVPYKGGAQLAQDVLGGQIAVGINTFSEVIEHHKAGRLRILAISSAVRTPTAPDVPTFIELGYKDLEGDGWFAFFAPRNTPLAAIEAWNKAIGEALADAAVHEAVQKAGFTPGGGTAAALAERFRSDVARWKPIVDASGFKLEE